MDKIIADWLLTDPAVIGGHRSKCIGKPLAVGTGPDASIRFNGSGDGIFLDANPLAGLKEFTVEAVFRPERGGPETQKFMHFGADSGDRFLFETRLPDPGNWCFDAALHSGEPSLALMDPDLLHPLDCWYHAAVSFGGLQMITYINGKQELSGRIEAFGPLAGKQTSIGVRMDLNSWFRGEIRRIRISGGVLGPGAFLDPDS